MASGSSLGRDPCSIPRAPAAPGLSSMWLQPPAPALPVPPDPRSTIAYSSMPVERPLLQGRPDHPDPLPLPSAATQFPYVHGWSTAGHVPGSCYGPFTSRNQYLPSTGPMEHFYSQAQLQPVAHLQLVQMQPPGQGHILSTPLQDGSGLYLYNYATLAPIPLEERSPVVQGTRAAPVPPASEAEVVLVLKEVEPEGLPTPAPAAGQRPVKPASREVQAPQGMRNRADVSGELPAQQAFREAQQTSNRLEVDQSQVPPQDGHQPSRHPQPSGKESLLPICKDDFKLPADLISIEYSDIEELIASLEPLIPEGPFPPLDPKDKRQEGTSKAQLSQSCLPMEVKGAERSFPLASADKEAIVDPYKLDKSSADPGAQKLPSPPKKPEATFPNAPKLSEDPRKTMLPSPIPVVQREQKMGLGTSKPLASIPAPRSATILHDIGFPFPPEVSRRKPLKKSLKRKAPGDGSLRGGDKMYGPMAKRRCCNSLDIASLNEGPQMAREVDPVKQAGMERSQGLQGTSSKRPLDGRGKRKAMPDAAEPLAKIPRLSVSPCRPKKDPCKNERKDKGRINPNLAKFKGVKEAKLEGDALSKPVPRSHLALQIMESVQVFYPLGKSSVSSMPPKKLQLFPPPPPPKNTAEKVPASSIQPKPIPSSHIKPMSSFLPKPTLISTSKPTHTYVPKSLSSIPKVAATLLSKPLPPTVPPKPGGSSVSWQLTNFMPKQPPELNLPGPAPSTAQVSQAGRLGGQASRAHKAQALPLRSFTAVQNSWRSSNPLILRRHQSCMFQPPSPPYRGDTFIPWRTPPDDLEESSPITEEQRPIREMMKWQAQKEREEAAQWTAAGRIKFFVEREKEMEMSISYGYPQR